MLAKILTKMRRWPCRHLAHRVMMSASEMGYEPATLDLVARGLGSGRFRLYEKPLRHIKSMADRGNPRALILLGRVMSARGRDEEALELIRKAMQGPAGLDFDGAGDALLYTGQLLMKKDKGQAEAALRKAALEYDDPTAYYYLAEMEKEGSLNRIIYYMKAASSGILQAAHKLGTIEMSKAVEAAKGKGSPDYRMAREWFQIAADGQYRESILSMAEICKDTGESDQEQQWLQKARDLKDGYDSE
jgi:TPR repeat protein